MLPIAALLSTIGVLESRRRWRNTVESSVELCGLWGASKERLRRVVSRCPSLLQTLQEPDHAFHRHGLVHTMLSSGLVDGLAPQVEYERREHVKTKDGGFIGLDWLSPKQPLRHDGEAPLVFVVHGLSGNSQSAHERRIVDHFSSKGWEVCAFNMRGSGGVPTTGNNPMFSTLWTGAEDLAEGLQAARAQRPRSKLCVVCTSMGAAISISSLGQAFASSSRDEVRVSAMVCVSPPFDAEECSTHLHKGSNRLVSMFLAQRLKLILWSHGITFNWFATDVYQIEKEVVTKLHGLPQTHEGVREYYRRGTPKPWLSQLQLPTLILAAKDDPILPPHVFPHEEADLNEHIVMALTQRGGHVGFLWREDWSTLLGALLKRHPEDRRSATANTWLPRVCEEFLSSCIQEEASALQPMSRL